MLMVRGAGLDRGLDAAAEEIVLGAGAVLARPFDIVGIAARARHRSDHHLVDLLRLQSAASTSCAPARWRGRCGCAERWAGLMASPAAVDVVESGAGKAADDGILGALGDLVDGGEVAFRGDRKAGLDDVDAHLVEQLGDFELLFVGHGGAGALLAVAQGGVENDDAVLLGLGWSGHDLSPFRLHPPGTCFGLLGARGFRGSIQPLSAQAQTPSRPSGGDKEQEPAENEGGAGGGHIGRPVHRADMVAGRHHLPSGPSVAERGKGRVN